jgi:ribosomal protein S18 acetylase RimI-like enzyme
MPTVSPALSLVPSTDAHFAWMLGEGAAPDALRLPPGGVDAPEILRLLRDAAAALAPARHAWLMVAAGEVVGLISLKHRPVDGTPTEIGFGVAPARRGRGHATAAIRELASLLPSDGVRGPLTAETRTDNHASQRALAKAGFRQVATRTDPEDGDLLVWTLDLGPPAVP